MALDSIKDTELNYIYFRKYMFSANREHTHTCAHTQKHTHMCTHKQGHAHINTRAHTVSLSNSLTFFHSICSTYTDTGTVDRIL